MGFVLWDLIGGFEDTAFVICWSNLKRLLSLLVFFALLPETMFSRTLSIYVHVGEDSAKQPLSVVSEQARIRLGVIGSPEVSRALY